MLKDIKGVIKISIMLVQLVRGSIALLSLQCMLTFIFCEMGELQVREFEIKINTNIPLIVICKDCVFVLSDIPDDIIVRRLNIAHNETTFSKSQLG